MKNFFLIAIFSLIVGVTFAQEGQNNKYTVEVNVTGNQFFQSPASVSCIFIFIANGQTTTITKTQSYTGPGQYIFRSEVEYNPNVITWAYEAVGHAGEFCYDAYDTPDNTSYYIISNVSMVYHCDQE